MTPTIRVAATKHAGNREATGTVNLGSLSQPYNGTARVATASTIPTGLTVNLPYNGLVNAPTMRQLHGIGTINDATIRAARPTHW